MEEVDNSVPFQQRRQQWTAIIHKQDDQRKRGEMDSLSRIRWFTASTTQFPFPSTDSLLFPAKCYAPSRHRRPARTPTVFSVLKTPGPVNELAEDDVLYTFLKEREVNGDFIAKVSDILWLRDVTNFVAANPNKLADDTRLPEKPLPDENDGGFLKLTTTNEWLLGNASAPVNKKVTAKELRDDAERRKRLNLLQYEAIKRELSLLTVSIGTACSGYCLIALSVQAAVSYATGVIFSCLYLQLLYRHADNLSRETVPQIFRKRKSKKIGIRSEDLEDTFEKVIKGSGLALSSSRLVIPAAIYGLWEISQHFPNDFFNFQLLPAMVGIFAYKAAALVQVYRDNEDLELIFPDSEE